MVESVWVTDLWRRLLADGGLAELVAGGGVTGATTSSRGFERGISDGAYDVQLRKLFDSGLGKKDAFFACACADAAEACDVLRPVWERTGGRDGHVSIELDPGPADDALGRYEQARRLHDAIARPNLLVTIPATRSGIAALEDSIAAGRSVHATLIFSVERYAEVAHAYRAGLARFRGAGGDVSAVTSVATLRLRELGEEADRRLEALGAPAELRGRLARAYARLACRRQRSLFAPGDQQWAELAADGAHPQRCVWISSSSEDDGCSLARIEGAGLPPAGVPGEAERLLDRLAEAGLDVEDAASALERDALARAAASFAALLHALEAKQAHPSRAGSRS